MTVFHDRACFRCISTQWLSATAAAQTTRARAVTKHVSILIVLFQRTAAHVTNIALDRQNRKCCIIYLVDVSPVLAAVIVEAEAQTSDDNKKGLSAAQISKKNPLAMIAVGAVLTGLLACKSRFSN